MMQTMPKRNQRERALTRVAEDNRTLLDTIDSALEELRTAETALETMRQHSLIVCAAVDEMSRGQPVPDDSADETGAVGAGTDDSDGSDDSDGRVKVKRETGAQPEPSVIAPIERFSDFAIAVICAWQGNSWGIINREPLTYGIFGFKGEQLQQVLDKYFSRSGEAHPQQPLSLAWYAEKAGDRHMRAAQLQVARDFLTAVNKLSIQPRGIRSPLGKLIIMDAAVDHGLTHAILKRTEATLGLDVIKADGRYIKPYLPTFYHDEALYCQRFALERLKARTAQWGDLPQRLRQRLKERYAWFEKLAYERDLRFEQQAAGAVRLPAINIAVRLPAELATAQRDEAGQLAYGSPVDPGAKAVLPPGWCSAIDHGEIYQRTRYKGQMHTGIDINRCDDVDEGLPVYAVAEGRIFFAGLGAGAWGKLVVIKHPDGMWSRYGHLKTIAHGLKPGQNCRRGELVGSIGRGHQNQFNAHLHFDMCKTDLWQGNASRWSAKHPAEIAKHYVDPVAFITARGWWTR